MSSSTSRSVVAPSCRKASNAARTGSTSAPRGRAAAHRRRLELEPHREQVVEILRAEANRHHPPVRARLDEALALEHLERAADRAAADRELGRELRLDERRPLGERAAHDRLAQLAGDPAGVDAPRELDRVLPAVAGSGSCLKTVDKAR